MNVDCSAGGGGGGEGVGMCGFPFVWGWREIQTGGQAEENAAPDGEDGRWSRGCGMGRTLIVAGLGWRMWGVMLVGFVCWGWDFLYYF